MAFEATAALLAIYSWVLKSTFDGRVAGLGMVPGATVEIADGGGWVRGGGVDLTAPSLPQEAKAKVIGIASTSGVRRHIFVSLSIK
jgi:hypothetical protein